MSRPAALRLSSASAPSPQERPTAHSCSDFCLSPVSITPAIAPSFVQRSMSLIYRFYAESLSNPFIHRIYTNRPGVGGYRPAHSDVPTCGCCFAVSVPSVHLWQTPSFQQLAASCFLLRSFFALVPFVFNRLQPLFTKCRGYGYPQAVQDTPVVPLKIAGSKLRPHRPRLRFHES